MNYYDNIEQHSVVSQVEPGYLRALVPRTAPEDGEAWDAIRADLDAKIVPGLTHWQSPNFFAFFPCPATYPSLLGELYSAAFSSAAFNWVCSPAVTELETIVLDWLAQLFALPKTYLSTGPTRGGGVMLGTASEAVMTAMVAARDKYLAETLPPLAGTDGAGDGEEGVSEEELEDLTMRKRSRLVALGSTACHSSTKKAAKVLGLRYVAVPATSATGFAMTGPALRTTLETCRAKGWEPFFLTAAMGTTDTCAVDDMGAIGEVLAEWSQDFPVASSSSPPGITNHGNNAARSNEQEVTRRKGEVWVHVDAAYAGSALVTPEARQAVGVHHLAAFHSFNVNLHKWLLTNFDASCLYVADRRPLEAAFNTEQEVYRNAYSDDGLVTDYRNWQVPLGRRFRALKVWFVVRAYGARGLREHIRRGTGLCILFAGWLRERADLFEIVTGPVFALTVFRVTGGPDTTEEQRNRWTEQVYDEVNQTGRIWLTSTVLEGKFAIRFMTANHQTEEKHVRGAWELIEATAERVVKESQ